MSLLITRPARPVSTYKNLGAPRVAEGSLVKPTKNVEYRMLYPFSIKDTFQIVRPTTPHVSTPAETASNWDASL
jgi:hypothetical protein